MTMSEDDPMHIPPHHRLDIESEPGFVVLRRARDGSVVARWATREVSWEDILRAVATDSLPDTRDEVG